MTQADTKVVLTSIAQLGVAIASGAAPAVAGTFALGAVIREMPHLFDLAAIILAKGQLTPEQEAESDARAVALSGGLAGIPAADELKS